HADRDLLPKALELIKSEPCVCTCSGELTITCEDKLDNINSTIDKEELENSKKIMEIEKTIDGEFEVTWVMIVVCSCKQFIFLLCRRFCILVGSTFAKAI